MAQQPFGVLLECALPGCMKAGFGYYTSTLSFNQDRVRLLTVRLVLFDVRPSWVRVYECGAGGATKLLKDLRPVSGNRDVAEYLDIVEGAAGQSARIYVFWRAGGVLDHLHPCDINRQPQDGSAVPHSESPDASTVWKHSGAAEQNGRTKERKRRGV